MTTEIVNWKDKLAQYAVAAVEQEQSSGAGSWINTKSGVLTYQKTPVAGNTLRVIVTNALVENQYYDVAFDPNNPRSPVCYAFGYPDPTTGKVTGMTPYDGCEKPQSTDCDSCPHNKFGSAENGKGKACKNVRRLAVLPASPLSAETLASNEPAWLKVPVMSVVKTWSPFVRLCGAQGKPPWAVITDVSIKPDTQAQFLITFIPVGLVPDDLLGVVENRVNEIAGLIEFPYRNNEEEEEEVKPAKKSRVK
jgi:hypothetical protein